MAKELLTANFHIDDRALYRLIDQHAFFPTGKRHFIGVDSNSPANRVRQMRRMGNLTNIGRRRAVIRTDIFVAPMSQ